MHRPALTRTQRRTRRTGSSARSWRTALEDRLAGYGTPWSGPHCAAYWNSRLNRRRSGPQWSFVHGSGARLWNDHARRGWRRSSWTRRTQGRGSCGCGNSWRCAGRHLRRGRRRNRTCRRCDYGRRWVWGRDDRTRGNCWSSRGRTRRNCWRRRCGLGRWWRNRGRTAHSSRRRGCRLVCRSLRGGTGRCRRCGGFLLLRNGSQHVSRPGDV
jgi:hypothetical protein